MLKTLLRQFGDERVAVGKMAIGRGAGDADALRRLGQGEAGRTALGDQRPRRREQCLAQPAMMVAPPFFGAPSAKLTFGGHSRSLPLFPPRVATPSH